MHRELTENTPPAQLPIALTFEGLADAKRSLAVVRWLKSLPVLNLDDRLLLTRVQHAAFANVGCAIDTLVDLLDVGTPDVEAEDATDLEDEGIQPHLGIDGLGCAAVDPDFPSWAEWSSLGRHNGRVPTTSLPAEDAELDDEDDGGDEAEPNFVRVRGTGAGRKNSDSDFGGEETGEVEDEI